MSKRVLTVLLAVMMAVGIYTAVASAGVEGDFTFDISIVPQWTATTETPMDLGQISKFDFDFEGLLNLDLTLSGLTISNDLAMGIAGLEHYIVDISTTLGALDLKDEMVFAVPYKAITSLYLVFRNKVYLVGTYNFVYYNACPTELQKLGSYYCFFDTTGVDTDLTAQLDKIAVAAGYANWAAVPAATQATLRLEIFPYTITKDYAIHAMQFVKKRASLDITLGGLDFSALILFEDSNFYHPYNYNYQSYQTPSYKFGYILDLKGTTVSGIDVESKTGWNACWRERIYYYPHPKLWYLYKTLQGCYNKVKKHTWLESYKANYIKEMVKISNITPISGLTIDSWTFALLHTDTGTWDLNSYYRATFDIANIATVKAWLKASSPLALTLDEAHFQITTDFGGIYWYDWDGDLTMSVDDNVWFMMNVPLQGATFTTLLGTVPTVGITDAIFEADIPLSVGTFEVTTEYAKRYDYTTSAYVGDLEFSYAEFTLDTDLNDVSLLFDAVFDRWTLESADIEVGLKFSL